MVSDKRESPIYVRFDSLVNIHNETMKWYENEIQTLQVSRDCKEENLQSQLHTHEAGFTPHKVEIISELRGLQKETSDVLVILQGENTQLTSQLDEKIATIALLEAEKQTLLQRVEQLCVEQLRLQRVENSQLQNVEKLQLDEKIATIAFLEAEKQTLLEFYKQEMSVRMYC